MDIDLDLPSTFDPRDYFKVTLASMINKNELVKHPAGAYFQTVPVDAKTSLCSIPYKQAENDYGCFKIDFLHLNLLDSMPFESKEQMRELLELEPNWNLLLDERIVKQLFQIKNHYILLLKLQPRSILELADAIALLRPAKQNLIDRYLHSKPQTRRELYKTPLPKGCFKKGHALAYAQTIVLQLHLLEAGLL
jgi:hypothetical protein